MFATCPDLVRYFTGVGIFTVGILRWIFPLFLFRVVIPEFCCSVSTFYLPVFYLLDVAYVFQQEFGTWEVIFMKYIFDLDEPAVATAFFDG